MTWLGRLIQSQDMRTPLRGGFLGIGGNGPDKQKESSAQSSLGGIFNYGLPAGQQQQAQGQQGLNQASNYWQNLLQGGRADYAKLSAPAINQAVDSADATRNQSAQFGSGRSGGDVAQKRDAATGTQKQVDDTLNATMNQGKAAGAAGIQGVANTELQNSLSLMGLGSDAISKVLASAQADRAGVRDAQVAIWSKVIGGLI